MTDVAHLDAGASLILNLVSLGRACIAFGSGLFGPDVPAAIAPDTTVIAKPLAEDGFPDYAAHTRRLLGEGVPPDRNAAVPLLSACWPGGIHKDDLATVCAEIGVPAQGPRGVAIVEGYANAQMVDALTEFVEERLPGEKDARDMAILLTHATDQAPWRGDDAPPLRDWLVARAAAFDLIVEASKRPTFYLPTSSLLTGNRTAAVCAAHGETQCLRDAGRALNCRSMWHLGEQRTADAWAEILAIHRLARLAIGPNHNGTTINCLIAVGLAGIASDATLRLLDSPHVTEADLAVIARDRAALPPLFNRSRLVKMEQLRTVACVVDFAIMPRLSRGEAIRASTWPFIDDPGLSCVFLAGIDWTVVLRSVNRWSAEVHHAFSRPLWSERRASLEALDKAAQASLMCEDPQKVAQEFFSLLFDAKPAVPEPVLERIAEKASIGFTSMLRAAALISDDRDARSETAGTIFMAILDSSHTAIDMALTRAETQSALTDAAVALARWRAGDRHHRYPERLDELVPRFLVEVPTDPFTGKPVVYERRGDGYLLYSLGANMTDDRGTGFNTAVVNGEWSEDTSHVGQAVGTDVVVRLPIADPPLLNRLRTAQKGKR
jgi:hypothetical protein